MQTCSYNTVIIAVIDTNLSAILGIIIFPPANLLKEDCHVVDHTSPTPRDHDVGRGKLGSMNYKVTVTQLEPPLTMQLTDKKLWTTHYHYTILLYMEH